MKWMRFYEDMFMAGDVFISYARHLKDGDFINYTIKTHRGYFTDRIDLFRYKKEKVVAIEVRYYDDNLGHHRRSGYIPYDDYKHEMMIFYDNCVNGG